MNNESKENDGLVRKLAMAVHNDVFKKKYYFCLPHKIITFFIRKKGAALIYTVLMVICSAIDGLKMTMLQDFVLKSP